MFEVKPRLWAGDLVTCQRFSAALALLCATKWRSHGRRQGRPSYPQMRLPDKSAGEKSAL
jgi:hypothetical protein